MNFDYTSRDYAAIHGDLLARAARSFPEWTNREPSDLGMMFVDLWAYMGDVLHYYVDRAAGESFLNTATQRESVIAIANLLDYVPTGRRAARATIQLDASSTTATDTNPIYIPKYTRFLATPLLETANQVVFTTDTDIAFVGTSSGASTSLIVDGISYATYPKTTTTTVFLTEGEIYTETYTATGLSNQRIPLRQKGVVTSSISVAVSEGVSGANVTYAYTDRLITATSSNRVFGVDVAADNTSIVYLGNGINGRIPLTNTTITITYRRSRGSAGNVNQGAIKAIESVTVPNKPALNGLVVIANVSKASGGIDAESIASLKANIPATFRTQDRAVSLQDYKDIVKRVPGVVRSTAYIGSGNVIEIRAVEEPSDYGADTTLVLSSSLVSDIQDYLEPREITFVTSNVGASVTLTPVNIVGSVQVKDGYVQESVYDNVVSAMRSLFSFDTSDFGNKVSLGTLYRTILDVEGVDYTVITRFTTTGSNVIDSSGGFTGVQASDTSMLVIAGTSTFTMTRSGGIVASGA